MSTLITKQYHVFLSHSSSDKAYVERIAERLVDETLLKPFLDKWHLVPGEPWQEALEVALDGSETCAIFLGPNGLGPWENEEMRSALDERVRGKTLRVIPVLLPGADSKDEKTLPRFLRRLTWVDFRTGIGDNEAFNSLVAGIRGQHPGRQVSVNVEREKKVKWIVVLSATIDEIDKPKAEAIIAHLRTISGDSSLTMKKIEQGSVVIVLEGTKEGFELTDFLYRAGHLKEVLGLKVLHIISEENGPAEIADVQFKLTESYQATSTELYQAIENVSYQSAAVQEAPHDEISYHAVEKSGSITAIWEMRGRKHIRTIDPRSAEGRYLLGYTEEKPKETTADHNIEAARPAESRGEHTAKKKKAEFRAGGSAAE